MPLCREPPHASPNLATHTPHFERPIRIITRVAVPGGLLAFLAVCLSPIPSSNDANTFRPRLSVLMGQRDTCTRIDQKVRQPPTAASRSAADSPRSLHRLRYRVDRISDLFLSVEPTESESQAGSGKIFA